MPPIAILGLLHTYRALLPNSLQESIPPLYPKSEEAPNADIHTPKPKPLPRPGFPSPSHIATTFTGDPPSTAHPAENPQHPRGIDTPLKKNVSGRVSIRPVVPAYPQQGLEHLHTAA